jgi:hypothetical protein
MAAASRGHESRKNSVLGTTNTITMILIIRAISDTKGNPYNIFWIIT